MKTEAEVRGRQRMSGVPPGAGQGRKKPPLSLQREVTLPAPQLWTSGLQTGKIYFCCFKSPSLGNLLWWPQETNKICINTCIFISTHIHRYKIDILPCMHITCHIKWEDAICVSVFQTVV